jgi:hypothetical protein
MNSQYRGDIDNDTFVACLERRQHGMRQSRQRRDIQRDLRQGVFHRRLTGLSLARPALLTIRSQHLDDNFPPRTPLGEVGKRIFCFLERKHLVDHRPDALSFEKFADFTELGAIGVRKEK